jgi:Zn-dependent metalloprotease
MGSKGWVFFVFFGVLSALPTWGAEHTGKVYTNGKWEEPQTSGDNWIQSTEWLPDWFVSKQNSHPLTEALNFLRGNSGLLNTNSSALWIESKSESSPELRSVRLKKEWNGLPVIGGDAVVHFAEGKLLFANADSTPLFGVGSRPRLSPAEAEATAFSSYQGRALKTEDNQLAVLILDGKSQKEAKLVYRVVVRDENQFASDIHFIDAETAEELQVTTNVHTLAKRKISAGLGSEQDFSLPFDQWQLVFSDTSCDNSLALGSARELAARTLAAGANPEPCNEVGAKAQASALSAWNNSGIVHKYYLSAHKRDSIDGQGMTMNAVVNFGGDGFPNAAWYNDKSLMLYGMGDEKVFNDFALPLDVAAHEITHGITSNTSNLEYVSESGALNESYSDVFGKLVTFSAGKTNDWKIGKELFKDGSRFIRDMENPEVAHYDNFRYKGATCSRFNDFCGVHSNSGIPNRAAVLLAKRIGLEKLGKLYYLTLTQLLRTNSTFKEAKDQTLAACQQLWGAKSVDCKAVEESFLAVGI